MPKLSCQHSTCVHAHIHGHLHTTLFSQQNLNACFLSSNVAGQELSSKAVCVSTLNFTAAGTAVAAFNGRQHMLSEEAVRCWEASWSPLLPLEPRGAQIDSTQRFHLTRFQGNTPNTQLGCRLPHPSQSWLILKDQRPATAAKCPHASSLQLGVGAKPWHARTLLHLGSWRCTADRFASKELGA